MLLDYNLALSPQVRESLYSLLAFAVMDDFSDWIEEFIESVKQNYTLVSNKLTAYTTEFEQEAIQPATKDANKLADKFSTQVFQPIARDLSSPVKFLMRLFSLSLFRLKFSLSK